MIIDMHLHPFCREVEVTPSLNEAFSRMFGQSGDEAARSAAMVMAEALFVQRGLDDVLRDLDAAGVDMACIVAWDTSTQYGVKLVTNDDVSRLAAAHPDRFIPFASVDPNMGRLPWMNSGGRPRSWGAGV